MAHNLAIPASAHRIRPWQVVLVASVFLGLSSIALIPLRASSSFPLGQFIVQCEGPVRSASDDPIVHPGVQNSSHLHEFYGNTAISADSTYQSLIGQPTGCSRDRSGGEPGDTAAYWHPTVYVKGIRTPVTKSTFYYTTRSRKDPRAIRPYPPGLKVIAGDSMAVAPQNTNIVYWGCGDSSSVDKGALPVQCGSGDSGLTVHVIFPDCWDGVHLDSPDHKSHMAYSRDSGTEGRCPASHPVSLPWLIMRFRWEHSTPNPGDITLSSGAAQTFHADFFNTWNQPRLEQIVGFCLNAGKKCDYQDLDNLPMPGGTTTTQPTTTSTTTSSTTTSSTSTTTPTSTTSTSTTTTSVPSPPPSGFVINGGFEHDLAGWEVDDGAVLGRSVDAHTGAFSGRLEGPGGQDVRLKDSPNFAASSFGLCTATAWVKAPHGTTVAIRLREYVEGDRRGSESVHLPSTGQWQLVAVQLRPAAGGTLDLNIYAEGMPPGRDFLVDDVAETCAQLH